MKFTKRLLLVFFMAVSFAACNNGIDDDELGCIEMHKLYYAKGSNVEMLAIADTIANGKLQGRCYAIDTSSSVVAQPFSVHSRKFGGFNISFSNKKNSLSASFQCDNPSVAVEYSKNGQLQKLKFDPLQQSLAKRYACRYLDSLYDVGIDKDIKYGMALGYWTSYSCPDANDYWGIVRDKLPQLLIELPQNLCMDVYYPINDSASLRPLLMLIHGGGYFIGDKAELDYETWSRYFASLGYVVASINYRLGFGPTREGTDRAGYKAVQDAHAAMRFIVHNAAQYKIDENRLFVGGTSAGAITSLHLAFMRNDNRPESAYDGRHRLFDKDLGLIEAVNPSLTDTFNIKAVINMWGAVYDDEMLSNSNTAILSFHGDADRIVAYGHDYPFKNVLTPIENYLDIISNTLPMCKNTLDRIADNHTPFNEALFGQMYGSSCIHHKAKQLGLHSELHTYPNGSHSLQVNDDNSLSDYFYVIEDTAAVFLYEQMMPFRTSIIRCSQAGPWFSLTHVDEIETFGWSVEGGAILDKDVDKVKAVFYSDATERKLVVSGIYKNGMSFCEEKKF